MASVTETATWTPGVYQIETTDPVQGGALGISNQQAKDLANRTLYLKGLVDKGARYQTVVEHGSGSGNIVLTAANVGSLNILRNVSDTPTNKTVKLPATSGVADGDQITLLFYEGYEYSVTPTGSDTIMQPDRIYSMKGDCTTFVKKGAFWFPVFDVNKVNETLTGSIIAYAGTSIPNGYIKCNGALVSRTFYPKLFAAIGTTFGAGDGSSTFGLPDLRGEFIRGWDDSRGVDTGRTFGSYQADELKAHTHNVGYVNLSQGSSTPFSAVNSSFANSTPTSSVGGNETRPRNVALNYIIKF